MSDNLYAFLIIVVFFCLIYGMYGMLVATVVKWAKKPVKNKKGKMIQRPLSIGELMPCYIPFVQICTLRRALYRTSTPWNILCGISAFCIVARLLNMFIPISSYVMFATIIMLYVGIILHLFIYGFVTASCVKLYGFGWFGIIVSCLFPYWVGPFLKNMIPSKMIDMRKEETFSAKNGNTYIKSKPVK